MKWLLKTHTERIDRCLPGWYYCIYRVQVKRDSPRKEHAMKVKTKLKVGALNAYL